MNKHLFPALLVMLLNLAIGLSAQAAIPDRTNVCASPYNAVPNDGQPDTGAISAAVAAGKSIYFPPGTYIFEGTLTLQDNKSYRLYGDGPGVSTIIFTGGATAGISGPNIGRETLTVEGLTLKAGCSSACGTAIDAVFGPHSTPPPANIKFHTATIHNVQIIGSARDGTSGSYWTNGIHLTGGANSIIDKVHISGNKNVTIRGIWLNPSPAAPENVTGFQLSNLQVKWCNSALLTSGYVEGIYLTGFEFTSCGWGGLPAIYLFASPGGTAHLVNGKVDSITNGMNLENFFFGKVSNVSFRHTGSDATDGTMLVMSNVTDVMVTECTFYGVDPADDVVQENGVYLINAHSVRIAGNNFKHMRPTQLGSCIVLDSNSSVVRVTDNLFDDVRQKINNMIPPPAPPAVDPYYNGNNPPP